MGGEQVNYGASIPVTAYMSPIIFKQMESWSVVDGNDRPTWIQKLEKEWGIR